MLELIDGLALYHGSYCEVTMPDLNKCARYKDFGTGFYLTTSKKQAESFAGISTRKAVANGIVPTEQRYGDVSSFKVMFEGELDVHIYNEADADWLHCIVGHRKKKAFPEIVEKLKACDVIAGKIADDNTNATITAYMVGTFGQLGMKSADDMCISLLLPERLQNQFCFRTNKALKCLTFMESEKIWL